MPINKKTGKRYNFCEANYTKVTGTDKWIAIKGTDIEDWGIGIALYYRFIRDLMCFIFIFMCINIFIMIICYKVYDQDTTVAEKGDSASKIFFNGVSLGGYSMGSNKFFEFDIVTDRALSVTCLKGTITNDSTYSYYGLIESNTSAKYIYNQYAATCNLSTNFEAALNACVGYDSCTLNYVYASWFDTACLTTNKFLTQTIDGTSTTYDYKAYIHLYCKDAKFSIFGEGGNYKYYYSAVIAGLSFAIVVFMIIFLVYQKILEDRTVSYFHVHRPSAPSFSIQIKGMPKHWTGNEIMDELYMHFDEYLTSVGMPDSIWDIKVAQNNEKFYLEK